MEFEPSAEGLFWFVSVRVGERRRAEEVAGEHNKGGEMDRVSIGRVAIKLGRARVARLRFAVAVVVCDAVVRACHCSLTQSSI